MNKEQLDYIYEYLDNLASAVGDLETEVKRLDNELFGIKKALSKKSRFID